MYRRNTASGVSGLYTPPHYNRIPKEALLRLQSVSQGALVAFMKGCLPERTTLNLKPYTPKSYRKGSAA